MRNHQCDATVRLVLLKADQLCDHGEASPALGREAQELAHDINNALQVVSGNLELLAGDVADSPSAIARLRRVRDGVQLGVRLVATVLETARQKGEAASREEIMSLAHFVELLPILKDAAGHGIDIELDADSGVWPVDVDLARFQNAFLNLAINARDAMHGRGRITLAVRNVPGEVGGRGDKVVYSMVDNGDGIAPNLMQKIFSPFFTTKAKGTGLGLAIVRDFGRASRADIAVESRLGFGTAFHLAFPRSIT